MVSSAQSLDTSPFSGGSLLGDRIRMREVADLENVFIRSMATRGALGGLNQSARDVAKIMDAFGMDLILIETVGVGQDEVEVVKTADLVSVVLVPGLGDGIQASTDSGPLSAHSPLAGSPE